MATEAAGDRPLVVAVENLQKSYRSGFWLRTVLTPLQSVSLEVRQGETFGLLGPNGAGKTTFLKILLGLVKPSGGQGTLLGHPFGDRAVRQRIGYLPENPYFYDYLTAWEFLEFTAGLFGLSTATRKERIPLLLEMVGLNLKDARKKQMRRYSKGMVQRVAWRKP